MRHESIYNFKQARDPVYFDHGYGHRGVEQAYSYKCSNLAELFPIVCHSFEDGVSEFDIKSGSMDGAGIFGMKLVSAFAGNSDLGLPRIDGDHLDF